MLSPIWLPLIDPARRALKRIWVHARLAGHDDVSRCTGSAHRRHRTRLRKGCCHHHTCSPSLSSLLSLSLAPPLSLHPLTLFRSLLSRLALFNLSSRRLLSRALSRLLFLSLSLSSPLPPRALSPRARSLPLSIPRARCLLRACEHMDLPPTSTIFYPANLCIFTTQFAVVKMRLFARVLCLEGHVDLAADATAAFERLVAKVPHHAQISAYALSLEISPHLLFLLLLLFPERRLVSSCTHPLLRPLLRPPLLVRIAAITDMNTEHHHNFPFACQPRKTRRHLDGTRLPADCQMYHQLGAPTEEEEEEDAAE